MQHFEDLIQKREISHSLGFSLRLEGRELQRSFQAGTDCKSCTKTINSAFTGCTEKQEHHVNLADGLDTCNAQLRRSSCITRIHPSILKCLWNLARKGETNQNILKSLRCSTLFNIPGHCLETAVARCCLCRGHISWDRNGAAAPSSQASWRQVTSGKQQ